MFRLLQVFQFIVVTFITYAHQGSKVIGVVPVEGSARVFSAQNGDLFAIALREMKKVLIYSKTGIQQRCVDARPGERFSGFYENMDLVFSGEELRIVGANGDGPLSESRLEFDHGLEVRSLDTGWLLYEGSQKPVLVPARSLSENLAILSKKTEFVVSDFQGTNVEVRIYDSLTGKAGNSFIPTIRIGDAEIPVKSAPLFASLCASENDIWHFGRYDKNVNKFFPNLPIYPSSRIPGSDWVVLFQTSLKTHRSEPVMIFQISPDSSQGLSLPSKKMLASIDQKHLAVVWSVDNRNQEVVIIEISELGN